jgi:hypothetical protein
VDYYQGLVFIIIPLWLAIFAVVGLYNQKTYWVGPENIPCFLTPPQVG